VSATAPDQLVDGDRRFAVDTGWAKVPGGGTLGDVAAVGITADGRVLAFSRGDHPMAMFDPDGTFRGSWGQDIFTRAHGLHVAPDGFLYCTDDGDHTVRKCTVEGEVVMTLGIPGRPSEYMSGAPFHRCTHTALAPDGRIYVSDGYGNASIHCFSPEGELLFSWGGSGSAPGEFFLPHNICCDADGWVYVADRENHRIQVFDGEGAYETQFNNLYRPCALALSPGDDPELYVGELGPLFNNFTPWAPNLGARVAILDRRGTPLASLGDRSFQPPAATQFFAPHGIAVDAGGDVYVAEVANAAWPLHYGQAVPAGLTTLRKLTVTNEGATE
jgi:DNA-binding beta-propeller fold protein YncE